MIYLYSFLLRFLFSAPVAVLACVLPALASDLQAGGLSWHVEDKRNGTTSLDWVEDQEDWTDLPKDVPLVLLYPHQDSRSSR